MSFCDWPTPGHVSRCVAGDGQAAVLLLPLPLGCPERVTHHDHVQWVKGGSLKDEIRAEENRSTAAVKSTKAW